MITSPVRLFLLLIACCVIDLLSSSLVYAKPSHAKSSATGPHIEVQLISEFDTLYTNRVNWLGVEFRPEDQWHTYWQNPGDSGEAPTMEWNASVPAHFGNVLWPIPKPIPVAHLTNFGYEGSNLLMVPLEVKEDISGVDEIDISASVSWLVCKEDCIPGSADLTIRLPINHSITNKDNTNEKQFGRHYALFQQTRERLPQASLLQAQYEVIEETINVQIDINLADSGFESSDLLKLLPLRPDVMQHSGQQRVVVSGTNNNTIFSIPQSDYFIAEDKDLKFLLTDGQRAYYVQASPNTIPVIDDSTHSLLLLFFMALVGGVLLNIMPCVLPVLSFKALSMTQATSNQYWWAYPLGVLVSLNGFALAIMLLKHSGRAIGWGFHMQEPSVIAFLSFLFLLIALMLLDIIPNRGRLSSMGQSLIEGNGFKSHFFTGVLAVIVASPCTAPFMAVALGVALVSELWISLWIFTGLAIGFALPLTLITAWPKAQSWLPKPGAWMNHFKAFLVFPMLATVIWLLWIYQAQMGSASLFILMSALLLFAFLCWVGTLFKDRLTTVSLLLALVMAVMVITQKHQPYRPDESKQNIPANHQAFSDSLLTELKNNNQVVLVNMTADWCITCKVNEQVAFNNDTFDSLIARPDVHYLVGDWTNKNPNLLEYLQSYKRSGVPLYVVYAGTHSSEVLPQVLTVNRVNNAIQNALKEVNHEQLKSL